MPAQIYTAILYSNELIEQHKEMLLKKIAALHIFPVKFYIPRNWKHMVHNQNVEVKWLEIIISSC